MNAQIDQVFETNEIDIPSDELHKARARALDKDAPLDSGWYIDSTNYKVGAHNYVYIWNNGMWGKSEKTLELLQAEILVKELNPRNDVSGEVFLKRINRKLTIDEKTALVGKYFYKQTQYDTSQMMGINSVTVGQLVKDAKIKLMK